jgi:hypothetical protein
MPIEFDELQVGMGQEPADRFYGKYRGTVINTADPLQQGRVQAMVPAVLGEIPSGWASPCVPYAGPLSGFFSIPPVGASVWIEFEAGDPSMPIWAGGWWPSGMIPVEPAGGPAQPMTTRIWRTETGLTVMLDDLAQTITLSDGMKLQMVELNIPTATVTIKGLLNVVSDAPFVKHGSATAPHPHVKGDVLMAYLTQVVAMFQSHMHPGETAAGVLPVTPAPPVPPFPAPPPSMLSTKVFLE